MSKSHTTTISHPRTSSNFIALLALRFPWVQDCVFGESMGKVYLCCCVNVFVKLFHFFWQHGATCMREGTWKWEGRTCDVTGQTSFKTRRGVNSVLGLRTQRSKRGCVHIEQICSEESVRLLPLCGLFFRGIQILTSFEKKTCSKRPQILNRRERDG